MRTLKKSLFVLLILQAYGLAQTAKTDNSAPGCPQPPKACGEPVKFLADKDNCSCYACEYGNPKQYTVCTNDKDAKLNLQKLADSDSEQLASAPIKTVEGLIKWFDGVATLTDKSGKTWDILNPDFKLLMRYSGQNVQIKGHFDDDKRAIRVMHVGTLPKTLPKGTTG